MESFTKKPTLAWSATLLLLAMTLLTAAPATADQTNCYAELISPQAGQASLTTQILSSSVNTGTTFQGVMVSTTGYVDVEIEHQCLYGLSLTVHKVEPDGTTSIIHQEVWDWTDGRFCDGDKVPMVEQTDVYIGLNAGEYIFEIGWTDCDREIGGDGDHATVFDPPLPIDETLMEGNRLF